MPGHRESTTAGMEQDHVAALRVVPMKSRSAEALEQTRRQRSLVDAPLQLNLYNLPIDIRHIFSVFFHAGGVAADRLGNVSKGFLSSPAL